MKLKVEMNVTEAQALTLKAMFEYWNQLSHVGSSRTVALYVDGDGDFHPNCKVTTDEETQELTDEIRERAITADKGGNRSFDHDGVAWLVEED